jgi:hypothetical protein
VLDESGRVILRGPQCGRVVEQAHNGASPVVGGRLVSVLFPARRAPLTSTTRVPARAYAMKRCASRGTRSEKAAVF